MERLRASFRRIQKFLEKLRGSVNRFCMRLLEVLKEIFEEVLQGFEEDPGFLWTSLLSTRRTQEVNVEVTLTTSFLFLNLKLYLAGQETVI